MALSGVNQSHMQPVWAEIPSHSADIGAVPRLFAASPTNNVAGALGNLSALPAQSQNLLADPVNFRLPNQYLPAAMDGKGLVLNITVDGPRISALLRLRFWD